MKCNHSETRYCRVQTKSGHIFFAVQCANCLELVKLPKHNNKLFLKASDIPIAQIIHAFEKGEGESYD